MAYTPELSDYYSGILRRVAWALKKPMTKTLEEVLDTFDFLVNPSQVCENCKDRSKCKNCYFNDLRKAGIRTININSNKRKEHHP